jgi:ribonucleoside-triphosphate reductase
MAIYKVQKRNGTIVTFERLKIEGAIAKAIEAAGGHEYSQVAPMTDEVIELLGKRSEGNIPHIERIQDVVEEVLIKA